MALPQWKHREWFARAIRNSLSRNGVGHTKSDQNDNHVQSGAASSSSSSPAAIGILCLKKEIKNNTARVVREGSVTRE